MSSTNLAVFVARLGTCLVDVADVEHGLGGEQEEVVRRLLLFFRFEGHDTCVLTAVEDLLVSVEHVDEDLGVFVAGGSDLLLLRELALDGLEVLELQLCVNDILVGCGVYGSIALTYDVIVVEAADDVDDGVALTDVTEELVAEALTLGGTLHQSGDIYDLTRCGHDTSRMDDLSELRQTLVGYGDDTEVGFNRTEGEVGCLCLSARQAVEKRGFADVRQAHDTTF
jgi:hypothetical protein